MVAHVKCWFGSFVVLQGIRSRIAKIPFIFFIFQGGGGWGSGSGTPIPPLEPRMINYWSIWVNNQLGTQGGGVLFIF